MINYILDFSTADSKQLNMMNNIEKELKSDRFREMDQMQLMVNVASLSVFPIVARPIIEPILNSRGVNYDDFIEQRKTCAPEFILHAITKDKTEN